MPQSYTLIQGKDCQNFKFRDTARFHAEYAFMAVIDGKIQELAEIRTYFSRTGATCYAAAWIHKNDDFRYGSGRVGGYGYDHESAAVSAAMYNLGIRPTTSFDSRGVFTMIDQMKIILKEYFNLDKNTEVVCHTANP